MSDQKKKGVRRAAASQPTSGSKRETCKSVKVKKLKRNNEILH